MSSLLRVCFVGEGPTDFVVLRAALTANSGGKDFVLVQIQPPADLLGGGHGEYGGGWKAVLRWCSEHSEGGGTPLSETIFANYDRLVVHLDCEIAHESELAEEALAQPCPPASATVENISHYLSRSLGITDQSIANKVAYMIPAQETEAWIVAAFFDDVPDLECLGKPSEWLETKRPRFTRWRNRRDPDGKTRRSLSKQRGMYESHEQALASSWQRVEERCEMARWLSSNVAPFFLGVV